MTGLRNAFKGASYLPRRKLFYTENPNESLLEGRLPVLVTLHLALSSISFQSYSRFWKEYDVSVELSSLLCMTISLRPISALKLNMPMLVLY
jgi:hypothetical protein